MNHEPSQYFLSVLPMPSNIEGTMPRGCHRVTGTKRARSVLCIIELRHHHVQPIVVKVEGLARPAGWEMTKKRMISR